MKSEYKRYEITDIQHPDNPKLHRIQALIDIPERGVKAGDLGGYIEHEGNLNNDNCFSKCWIFDDAMVYDNAHVYHDTMVKENARVYGNACVRGAVISGNAEIFDSARFVSGAIFGNAKVFGDASVYSRAKVYGNAKVFGNAEICGNAEVFGNSKVYGNACVGGNARVCRNAEICGDHRIFAEHPQMSSRKYFENLPSDMYNDQFFNESFYIDCRVYSNLNANMKVETSTLWRRMMTYPEYGKECRNYKSKQFNIKEWIC